MYFQDWRLFWDVYTPTLGSIVINFGIPVKMLKIAAQ